MPTTRKREQRDKFPVEKAPNVKLEKQVKGTAGKTASGEPQDTVCGKAKAEKAEMCVLCCQKVTAQDEVLICNGKCSGPVHRYCAGISIPHFKLLRSDAKGDNNRVSESFLCLACTQQAHKEVSELKDIIVSLQLQVRELGEVLKSSHSATSSVTS